MASRSGLNRVSAGRDCPRNIAVVKNGLAGDRIIVVAGAVRPDDASRGFDRERRLFSPEAVRQALTPLRWEPNAVVLASGLFRAWGISGRGHFPPRPLGAAAPSTIARCRRRARRQPAYAMGSPPAEQPVWRGNGGERGLGVVANCADHRAGSVPRPPTATDRPLRWNCPAGTARVDDADLRPGAGDPRHAGQTTRRTGLGLRA